jgi:2-haloacid dehalogenase
MAGIQACVFDAYGTLFDVHSAVRRLALTIGPEADRLSELWRARQLEYTWLRSLMGRHADFWQVTGDALDYALDRLQIDAAPIREALMQAYLALDAYPEAPGVLDRLRGSGLKIAILSNGEPRMLEAAARSTGLSGLVDHILSVEAVGVYKPQPRVYALAVTSLGLAANQIAFVSSNAWDVNGASSAGLQTVWINRLGVPAERLPGRATFEVHDLSGLPPLVGL